MINIYDYLRNNEYPGRGILVGCKDGQKVLAYFIMGRSFNSRNRVFRKENDIVFTKAYDESLVEDPSLIIYNAVRNYNNHIIVTNGDQTDTICEFLKNGRTFEDALRTREYEPDDPNFTPRISAILKEDSYEIGILKKTDDSCERTFWNYEMKDGIGHFISTYDHNGDPLPSFSSSPIEFELNDGFMVFSQKLWHSLNFDNKISLYVRMGDSDIIYNKNEGGME